MDITHKMHKESQSIFTDRLFLWSSGRHLLEVVECRSHIKEPIDDVLAIIAVLELAAIWRVVSWSIDVMEDRSPSIKEPPGINGLESNATAACSRQSIRLRLTCTWPAP